MKNEKNDKDRRLNTEKEQQTKNIYNSGELKAHSLRCVVLASVCLYSHDSHKYQYHPPFK